MDTSQLSGTFHTDETGDYAFDDGLQNLKKRIYRRLVTRRGGFAFMFDYGVGVMEKIKHLDTAAVRQRLASEAERQIGLEPDVAAVRVRPVQKQPGLVVFVVLVRTTSGSGAKFEYPFNVG